MFLVSVAKVRKKSETIKERSSLKLTYIKNTASFVKKSLNISKLYKKKT